jgi:hypothetical protein
METNDPEIQAKIKERMAQLPQVVQDAITSADVQKQMRSVSQNHQLHVDQWGILENEVQLTLLGFANSADLPKNLQNELDVSAEEAEKLANDINDIVFEPIRQELERQLEHPDAQEKQVSTTEAAGAEILAGEKAGSSVVPATPPAPKPTEKAVRTPISSSYTSRQPSTERKDIKGDPYRELPQ